MTAMPPMTAYLRPNWVIVRSRRAKALPWVTESLKPSLPNPLPDQVVLKIVRPLLGQSERGQTFHKRAVSGEALRGRASADLIQHRPIRRLMASFPSPHRLSIHLSTLPGEAMDMSSDNHYYDVT